MSLIDTGQAIDPRVRGVCSPLRGWREPSRWARIRGRRSDHSHRAVAVSWGPRRASPAHRYVMRNLFISLYLSAVVVDGKGCDRGGTSDYRTVQFRRNQPPILHHGSAT